MTISSNLETHMEPSPIQNDARSAQHSRRLGEQNGCTLCPEQDPETLTRVDRTLLERHHVVAQANDDALTIVICRNCHAKLTAKQLEAGAPMTKPPTRLHGVAAILDHLATFFQMLCDACRRWAKDIRTSIEALDKHHTGWRDSLAKAVV
jgi:hypothetical protein